MSNVSYFAKCFKSEFDVTPKEYQQREVNIMLTSLKTFSHNYPWTQGYHFNNTPEFGRVFLIGPENIYPFLKFCVFCYVIKVENSENNVLSPQDSLKY